MTFSLSFPDGMSSTGSAGFAHDFSVNDFSVKSLVGHYGDIRCCAFTKELSLLATGADDNTLRLWDLKDCDLLHTLRGHHASIKCVTFCSDDTKVASGGFDCLVNVWDVSSGRLLNKLHGHSLSVETVSFSHSGLYLCSGSWDNSAILWELSTNSALRILDGHDSVVQCCAFSLVGHLLATGSWDYKILVYNVVEETDIEAESKETRGDVEISSKTVEKDLRLKDDESKSSASLRPKSRIILTGERRREKEKPMVLTGHTSNIVCVVFSALNILASASWDCTVRLWDPSRGTCIRHLSGHEGYVQVCTFSFDGSCVASAADDSTVRIWSVETGECEKVLDAHIDEVHQLAFTLDGSLLASGPEKISLCLK